jgi:C_GCAxxG_C_C family probable redox protein
MTTTGDLKEKVTELGQRAWDLPAIEARFRKLLDEGIPEKQLDKKALLANKQQVLDRVRRHAEEYNLLFKNCAQSTALALLEEFGLGNMQIVQALCAFPGIAGSGEICGGITGSLIAFGLYFGKPDATDAMATGAVIGTGQKFMSFFEDEIGYIYCADIIEKVTVGSKINPGESEESMASFAEAKGFEKCGLPPGVGARLAAGFIIDSMNRD